MARGKSGNIRARASREISTSITTCTGTYSRPWRWRELVKHMIADLTLLVCGIHRAEYGSNGSSSLKHDDIFRPIECKQSDDMAFSESHSYQPLGDALYH